ncbi:hypothetical protein CXF68_12740 [Tenacibaculum sp. Bg11-29]|uniref:hypothetical protein n=1 Tax=Tenacibaculum sp. Bg11-29 TaxID=2058306 RepID=UPI000C3252F9|nr:hypothetical protein [Tenacibaculum sp. Bg11-29]PKH51498.1 hypothetical protein CXF68_12740 [Tenacibaculum sp. Bg11-29]
MGEEKTIANKKTTDIPFNPAVSILSVESLIEIAVNMQTNNKTKRQILTETNTILNLDCSCFFFDILMKAKE